MLGYYYPNSVARVIEPVLAKFADMSHGYRYEHNSAGVHMTIALHSAGVVIPTTVSVEGDVINVRMYGYSACAFEYQRHDTFTMDNGAVQRHLDRILTELS